MARTMPRSTQAVLLGIDIGTYSSKGVACLSNGTILAEARLAHGVSAPRPGQVEHDADAVWWHDLVGLCGRLIAAVGTAVDIGAVAVTTCGPCLVPVDRAGRPLRPGILYGIDTRAVEQIAAFEARIGRRAIRSLSRMGLTSQSIGPKIAWIAEHEPLVYAQTSRFHTATSYLVFRLTGSEAIDHHQASYFGPFISARRGTWDLRHARGLNLAERLPAIRWTTEIAGTVTAAAAASTGLPVGIPVLVGTSDGPTEAASVGALEPGVVALTYGSTTTLTTFDNLSQRRDGLWDSDGIFPGRRSIGAGLSTSGAITSWLRHEFGRELAQGDDEEISRAHDVLAGEAAGSPVGASGLLVLPYFNGERTPIADPLARGTIAGVTLAHTRGDLYRAILEGVAFGVRHLIETMRGQEVPVSRLRVAGGGTSSRLAMQIVSDVIGLEQEVPEVTIGAAYGVAYLAALATGPAAERDRPSDAWVRIADRIVPDRERAPAYGERYGLYRQLYRDTRRINHALARSAGATGARATGARPEMELASSNQDHQ